MRASVVALVLFLPCASVRAEQSPAAGTSEPASIWKRIFVIGASASAGFNTAREAGETVSLARVIGEVVKAPHEEVRTCATPLFFLQPMLVAHDSIRRAREAQPTLLVAVDFLFWFAYGVKKDEAERLPHLEKGLELLEEFSCPIVVSGIPDMRDAIGKMLSPRQVPRPETIRAANERIQKWAAERENVVLVPVVEFFDDLKAGRGIQAAGTKYPPGSLRRLLQRDDLHPTVEGIAAIAVLALEAFAKTRGEAVKAALDLDVEGIAGRVLAAVHSARAEVEKARSEEPPEEEGAASETSEETETPPERAEEAPPGAIYMPPAPPAAAIGRHSTFRRTAVV